MKPLDSTAGCVDSANNRGEQASFSAVNTNKCELEDAAMSVSWFLFLGV